MKEGQGGREEGSEGGTEGRREKRRRRKQYHRQHGVKCRGHLLVVSLFCGCAIYTVSINTPHHVVELRSGQDTWEEEDREEGGRRARGGGRREGGMREAR